MFDEEVVEVVLLLSSSSAAAGHFCSIDYSFMSIVTENDRECLLSSTYLSKRSHCSDLSSIVVTNDTFCPLS